MTIFQNIKLKPILFILKCLKFKENLMSIEESDIFKRDSVIIKDLRDQFDLMRSKLNN